MRLLICTQKVDKNDPILGFFHRWIIEFAKHFENITVICLYEGEHDLPKNVTVLSLGKENGASRVKYIFRFYRYIWQERNTYDAVFVHMNEEYVLLGGFLWKLLGRKIYMWRNHYEGNLLTDMSASLCAKVFCTSKYSYTAKYAKTVLMPVGIDTDIFKIKEGVSRIPNSVLFIARMAPSKNPEVVIRALALLKSKNIYYAAAFYGDPSTAHREYYESLQKLVSDQNLADRVHFYPGVKNTDTPALYGQYEICVNASMSGMYDKTIFEGIACGTLPLVCSYDFAKEADRQFIFEDNNHEDLASKIEGLLKLSPSRITEYRDTLRTLVEYHSLVRLAQNIRQEITSSTKDGI